MRKVIRLLSEGRTLEHAAFQAGISRDAWERRAARDSRFRSMTTCARIRGLRIAIATVTDRLHTIALDWNAPDRVSAAKAFLAAMQWAQTHIETKLKPSPSFTGKDLLAILADREKTRALHEYGCDLVENDINACRSLARAREGVAAKTAKFPFVLP